MSLASRSECGAGGVEWVGLCAALAVVVLALITAATRYSGDLAEAADCAVRAVVDRPAPGPCAGRRPGGPGSTSIQASRDSPGGRGGGATPTLSTGLPITTPSPGPSPTPDPYAYDRYWDTGCDAENRPKGCLPPPGKVVFLNPVRGNAVVERQIVKDVNAALLYHYNRFGWSGIDGRGRLPIVRAAPHHPSAGTYCDEGAIGYGNNGQINGPLGRGTGLHELTHLITCRVWGPMRRGESSPLELQEGALVEGMAMMSELEARARDYVGNLPDRLPAFTKQPWECPVDEGIYDPYPNARILLRAYADMARAASTVTFSLSGGAVPPTYDPAWDRLAQVRWKAMFVLRDRRVASGVTTFGDVRQAFIDAARAIGFDVNIVARGFDTQGITSSEWEPPPCKTYHP